MAALSSLERLVIKPTRSAIGGRTVTIMYTVRCPGGWGGGTAAQKGMIFKQFTLG